MPTPNATEKNVEGFLVSKTDTKGKILYCNEEFISISGYSEKELLGQPHSIVRHPDMPRTIFKYLWGRIVQGKEVNAYVKNLAKDGSFYWVFANIYPAFTNNNTITSYNSVRRKPSKNGLEFAKDLYAELKKVEQNGIDAGLAWFTEYFQSRGVRYENAVLCWQSELMC